MSEKATNENGSKNEGSKYVLCPEFMKLAHLYMDGEANSEEVKLFLAHVEASSDCQNHYMEEQEIRALIKKRCGCDSIQVPDRLIQMIQSKLRDQSVA
jgi:mycothiol system anti-sigma-R factor